PAIEAALAEIHLELGRPFERALNQSLAERILDILLQRASQWTSPVATVTAGLLEDVLRGIRMQTDFDILRREILVDLIDQKIDDLDQVVIRERREQNRLVETVQKLGIEGFLDLAHHLIFDFRGHARCRPGETHRAALL